MRFLEIMERSEFEADVSVSVLSRLWSPYRVSPWPGCPTLTRKAVARAIATQDGTATPHDPARPFDRKTDMAEYRDYHAKRVAYLVEHPSREPITVIEDDLGGWELHDGFHRLAAAIYRGDPSIRVHVSDPRAFLKWLSLA